MKRDEDLRASFDGRNNRVNYQRELEKVLAENREKGVVPTLLLHACCAPCSSYVLEYLAEYFSITLLYYNPNIEPEAEYDRRADEAERLARAMPLAHPVTFVRGRYEPEAFHAFADALAAEPEGGARCHLCYEQRLREAAREAKRRGLDYFTTTLTISPLKDAQVLNAIGQRVAAEEGVAFLPSDFKKRGGFLRSTELSEQYGLYRQDYCGCVFSRRES